MKKTYKSFEEYALTLSGVNARRAQEIIRKARKMGFDNSAIVRNMSAVGYPADGIFVEYTAQEEAVIAEYKSAQDELCRIKLRIKTLTNEINGNCWDFSDPFMAMGFADTVKETAEKAKAEMPVAQQALANAEKRFAQAEEQYNNLI